ncbi:MAG: glycosyltransferase family 87 protein [Planctomycetota bacterium]
MDDQLPTRSRHRWMVLLLVVAAIVVGWLAVKRAVNGNADLSGNYRLWRINLQESTLPVRREGPQPQDPDAYPPITYALFAPLGALPLWATATLWYLLNLGCSVYLWRAARDWIRAAAARAVPQDAPPQDTAYGWLVRWCSPRILNLAIVGIFPAWIGSLLLGQNTLPLMVLTWAGFQAARRQQPWLAGAMLAVATTIKVLPVVFLLPFILTRNYRVIAAFTLAGMLLVGGLGSLYFGPNTNLDFHRKWLKFVVQGPEDREPNPLDPNTLRGSLRYHNQSLEAVLARLLMDVPIHNREGAPRVNVLNVSAATWRQVRSAASGVCVVLALLVLYRSARSRQVDQAVPVPSAIAVAGETSVETFAVLSLLQLLVSPIVWSHYYLWLFWPLLLVLVEAGRGRRGGYALYLGWLAAMPFMAVPQVRAMGLHLWLTIALLLWIGWPRLAEWFRWSDGKKANREAV